MGKVNLLGTEKVWENTEISHILCYDADLELMRVHAIPSVWECTSSHKMERNIIARLCVGFCVGF